MRFALNTNCHGPRPACFARDPFVARKARRRATQPTQHKPSCVTKDMDFLVRAFLRTEAHQPGGPRARAMTV